MSRMKVPYVWRIYLGSKKPPLMSAVQHCLRLSKGTLGLPLCIPKSKILKGRPTEYASIPGVHLVTVYHSDGMGHGTLWDMSHCPITSHGTLGRDEHLGLIMGFYGTSQVIPSHPMGLIGIAATVPGTFGIPNVPMDIVGNAAHAGPSYLQGLNLHIYILYTRFTIHDGISL